MKTKLIIITGKAQSGKDTASSFIKNFFDENNKSSDIYSFAYELKKICENLFGLSSEQCWGTNEDKDKITKFKWSDLPLGSDKLSKLMLKSSMPKTNSNLSAREVMQIWGTDIFRSFDQDCWVRSTINRIKSDNKDFAIISDARFPNEIEFAKVYNPVIIRLKRDALKHNHESEIALDKYDFDSINNSFVIDNSYMTIGEKNQNLKNIIEKMLL